MTKNVTDSQCLKRGPKSSILAFVPKTCFGAKIVIVDYLDSKSHEMRKKSSKFVYILAKQCTSPFNLTNFLTFFFFKILRFEILAKRLARLYSHGFHAIEICVLRQLVLKEQLNGVGGASFVVLWQ